MGACFSSPAASKYSESKANNAIVTTAVPDFGLAEIYTIKKFLGRGAEGEAWLGKVNHEHSIKYHARP